MRGKVLDDREPHRLPQRGVNLSPVLGPVLLDASDLHTRLRRVGAQPGKFGNHVRPTNVYKGRMASD